MFMREEFQFNTIFSFILFLFRNKELLKVFKFNAVKPTTCFPQHPDTFEINAMAQYFGFREFYKKKPSSND